MTKDDEIRILRNYISNMPKVYRQRKQNWVVVQDILMRGTSTAGRTSSVAKCIELGINPDTHEIYEVKK